MADNYHLVKCGDKAIWLPRGLSSNYTSEPEETEKRLRGTILPEKVENPEVYPHYLLKGLIYKGW